MVIHYTACPNVEVAIRTLTDQTAKDDLTACSDREGWKRYSARAFSPSSGACRHQFIKGFFLDSASFFFLYCTHKADFFRVKRTSRQQGELLGEFERTVATLRSKLLEYYDTRIEELGQDLVDAKMRTESIRVTAALEKALDELDPDLSPKHRETLVRTYLNEASNYLVQLRRIYFDQNYCELSKRLQPEFLKTPCGNMR
jgi:hypothetical protein